MSHAQLFEFEADFVETLRCVPMAVRLKLDRAGIKLSLRQWSRFTRDDRALLLIAPCVAAQEVRSYEALLVRLVRLRAGEEAKPLPEAPPFHLWEGRGPTPAVVSDWARDLGVDPPSDVAWGRLTPLQRFVLVKLTRDNHDNVNFLPAMREFGLVAAEPTATARGRQRGRVADRYAGSH